VLDRCLALIEEIQIDRHALCRCQAESVTRKRKLVSSTAVAAVGNDAFGQAEYLQKEWPRQRKRRRVLDRDLLMVGAHHARICFHLQASALDRDLVTQVARLKWVSGIAHKRHEVT